MKACGVEKDWAPAEKQPGQAAILFLFERGFHDNKLLTWYVTIVTGGFYNNKILTWCVIIETEY